MVALLFVSSADPQSTVHRGCAELRRVRRRVRGLRSDGGQSDIRRPYTQLPRSHPERTHSGSRSAIRAAPAFSHPQASTSWSAKSRFARNSRPAGQGACRLLASTPIDAGASAEPKSALETDETRRFVRSPLTFGITKNRHSRRPESSAAGSRYRPDIAVQPRARLRSQRASSPTGVSCWRGDRARRTIA
jgi:hypothetical protein